MTGLLLLNKPQGITSYGAVAKIKRLTGEKHVGHTGTLDPMATGVLPVLTGRATALSAYLLDADKRYRATVKLGIRTDTDDITGKIIGGGQVCVTNTQIDDVLVHFTGEQLQTPPAYSALKKDGVRFYSLARQGIEALPEPRKITIYYIKLVSPINENHEFSIDLHVSKGTYIRSLCRDIGEYLGCGGTLSALCRSETYGFALERCVSLDSLTVDNLHEYMLNPEAAVMQLREIQVTDRQAERFCHGGQLSYERLNNPDLKDNEPLRIKYGNELIGIGFADNKRQQIGIKCVLRQ